MKTVEGFDCTPFRNEPASCRAGHGVSPRRAPWRGLLAVALLQACAVGICGPDEAEGVEVDSGRSDAGAADVRADAAAPRRDAVDGAAHRPTTGCGIGQPCCGPGLCN